MSRRAKIFFRVFFLFFSDSVLTWCHLAGFVRVGVGSTRLSSCQKPKDVVHHHTAAWCDALRESKRKMNEIRTKRNRRKERREDSFTVLLISLSLLLSLTHTHTLSLSLFLHHRERGETVQYLVTRTLRSHIPQPHNTLKKVELPVCTVCAYFYFYSTDQSLDSIFNFHF